MILSIRDIIINYFKSTFTLSSEGALLSVYVCLLDLTGGGGGGGDAGGCYPTRPKIP
jgi:hypothetical protein